ncbi:MAG: ion channel [Pseudomonadota bacterium]
MWRQIFFGSVVLALCTTLHIGVLSLSIDWLQTLRTDEFPYTTGVLAIAFVCVLLGHTAQVWIWASSFVATGAVQNLEDAAYFALVTTTTLGYGDITLPRPHRLFGAMAAVSGLLTFGLSTAFLVGIVTHVFAPNIIG